MANLKEIRIDIRYKCVDDDIDNANYYGFSFWNLIKLLNLKTNL